MAPKGVLHVVSTPIGNLGDVTHRALQVLGEADAIFAEDTRRTRILLDHYGIAPHEIRSLHQHNEARRTEEVRELLEAGASVALVSDSGTPLVSDPGHRVVSMAVEIGAPVVPVPGPSSALAALVASGLETEPFTFLGFVPRSGRARREFIDRLARLEHTAVFFESPHRLVAALDELASELQGGRQVVVARELTKVHEEFQRGTLQQVAAYYRENAPRGEIVVCLAGAERKAPAEREQAARGLAAALTRQGASSRDIMQLLQDHLGIERNRAYALALEATGEGEAKA